MFLQSANSGILDPGPRQQCFQREPFVLTNTVKVSKRSTNSRQTQKGALMDRHDGPERTTQRFCRDDRELFCQMAAAFKAVCYVRCIGARSNSYTGRCAPGLRLLELGSGLAGEAPSHIEDMFKRAIQKSTSTRKRDKQMLHIWSLKTHRFRKRRPQDSEKTVIPGH